MVALGRRLANSALHPDEPTPSRPATEALWLDACNLALA
jgi:hypothetical protein